MLRTRVIATVAGLGVLGAAAAGLVAAGTSSAAAAPAVANGTGLQRVAGKISALQPNGFTIQDKQQTYTVTVGSNTWIVVDKNAHAAEGALTDLKAGAQVAVAGTASGSSGIAARVVTEGKLAKDALLGSGAKHAKHGQAAHAKGHRLHQATLKSTANGTLTLTEGKNAQHTATVATDAGTIVLKGGLASVNDLKAGDMVTVLRRHVAPAAGTATSATRPTPTAELLYVQTGNDELRRAEVKSLAGGTLTLHAAHGAETVATSSSTIVKSIPAAGQAAAAASLSDIKAGSRVLLYGQKPVQGQQFTPSLVLILPAAQK